MWLGGGRMRAGWGGGSPSRAGLCAGGRTKQPLCVRWPSGTGLLAGGCGQSTFVLEAAWRGSVCSPRFGCEAGRRPEGGRRRSSGQTGSGLGRRLSGRRSRSGGLRGAAQAQAVRRAGRQSGRRRQRGSGVPMGEAQQRGRPQPLSAFLPNTMEVESGHCARRGNGGRAEWQLSGN